jgi:FAD synthetase
MEKTAGIVIIGDEILSGKFAEENARFLIGALAELGVALGRIAIIPDDLDDIAETVKRFSERFDVVITSGGVGPTHDDVTMAGIARGFGTQVVTHPRLVDMLRDHWGEGMPPANIRLAEIPEGAELIYGQRSPWPVVCYGNVYILPGVPKLFRKKFLDIQERFRCRPTLVARIFANADEGELAPYLEATQARFAGIKVGSYPRFDEIGFRVILTLETKDADLLSRASEHLEQAIQQWVVRVEHPDHASGQPR